MLDACCLHCKYRKTLWWWIYKEDGHLSHKEYGHCCTLFLNDDSIMKLDYVENGMCEMFTPKKGGVSNETD